MENKNENKVVKEAKYKPVNRQKNNSSNSYGKSVIIPFVSGILGATLVIGTCFGVPNIKNKLLSNVSTSRIIQSSSGTSNVISSKDYSGTAISVADKILPSIVGIEVEYSVNSIFYRQSSKATATGSGIIISDDGYILTNNHIIDTSSSTTSSDSFYQVSEANKVIVKLYNDETEYEAKIIGTDSQTDLAVIKIDKSGLTPAELGNSDSVKVGEFAMAVGNPLGMDTSVTCGVISATNVTISQDGVSYNLIQTDTAINSGNSGGALVNADGEVIGINTLKISSEGVEGMGFAIPINSTIDVYQQLIEYNKVKRPYIGISGIDLDEITAKEHNLVQGIYIKSVDDFSAAEKAGLKTGDVIIQADGKDITTMDELNEIKNAHQIGDTMSLKINRDGKESEINVTLQEQK